MRDTKTHMLIYDTPLLAPILRVFSAICLKLLGWHSFNHKPAHIKKCIFIAAPHTSNWDFILFILVAFQLRLRLYVLIKKEFFWFPLNHVLHWCGAVAVNRQNPTGMVRDVARAIETSEEIMLVITPEGTRSARTHWKTGFLRMAAAARVSVVLGYIDSKNKKAGASDIVITPEEPLSTQYIEARMAEIYAFYDKKSGLRPDNYASPNRPHE